MPRLLPVEGRVLVVAVAAFGALAACSRTDLAGLNLPATPESAAPAPMLPGAPPAPPSLPLPPPPASMPPGAGVGLPEPVAAPTPVAMPLDVASLLQSRCAGCHTYGEADQGGWGSVLDLSRMVAADIVVPGDPDGSRLINRVAVVGDMPLGGRPLGPDEVEGLRAWIRDLRRPARPPLTDGDVLDAISTDLIALRSRSADFRYFSFSHFLAEGRPAEELEAGRRLLAFLVNSLSRKGNLVELGAVDEDQSIWRVRLGELGWDKALWDRLTSFYPYCVRSDQSAHEALYRQLGTEAPVVRADWFIATASRSPLYELLLDLPANLDLLAARLGLDLDRDINHPGLLEPNNLVRVGLRESAVARHNRLLERHLGGQGQYLWITYDFTSAEGSSDLFANPLGPRTRDRQNFTHTFEHAGGEVIFTLPNGMQGYLLVDAAGDRLSRAPLEMVRDPRRQAGIVENGLSCFGCHANPGVLRPGETDQIAAFADMRSASFLARELDEIEASYPRVLRPDVFTLDAARYRATVGALPGGGSPGGAGEYLPIVQTVGHYEAKIGFQGAAAELGEDAGALRTRLRNNDLAPGDLPRTPAEPLSTRDKFVCLYRSLVPRLRANAAFCSGTFSAEPVLTLCAPAP